jgi:predicted RNase H-like HicB family nuclease
MKRKFEAIITKEGAYYVARCPEVANAVARGRTTKAALEELKAILIKKFRPDDGSEDGTAPIPNPVSPPPRGPRGSAVAKAASHGKPDA